MPISRDPRQDRRRRVLRENAEGEVTESGMPTRTRRSAAPDVSEPSTRRGAGYSHDVRNACGHRLVQFIPIRRRSFAGVIGLSFLLPALLLFAHYLVYVNGKLAWYGHPLALALDAAHPQSIAAWLSSHLWLLCLGATLLTFQLRRHKLDDYNGDYRLWFWLVITCLLASIDSTTHASELFGLALHRWSVLNLGWSGPAVVKATLAVMIGMLGLRLCSELKVVPLSLCFWLVGLVAWAVSAALGPDELKISLTPQFRIFLRCALWLGGLTAIWLSALTYLRHVYIEAQHRFLLRGRLAAASHTVPLGRRIRESLPKFPTLPAVPSFRRKTTAEGEPAQRGGVQRRWALPSFKRPSSTRLEVAATATAAAPPLASSGSTPQDRLSVSAVSSHSAGSPQRPASSSMQAKLTGKPVANQESPPARTGWLRRAKDSDDAIEYRKLQAKEKEEATQARAAEKLQRKQERKAAKTGGDVESEKPARRWLPKLLKLLKPKLLKPKLPQIPLPKLKSPSTSWLPKLKLPTFGLSALKLQPPEDTSAASSSSSQETLRPVTSTRPLPGTARPQDEEEEAEFDDDESGRTMSKAERKRLRRQQQNRAA